MENHLQIHDMVWTHSDYGSGGYSLCTDIPGKLFTKTGCPVPEFKYSCKFLSSTYVIPEVGNYPDQESYLYYDFSQVKVEYLFFLLNW